MPRRTVRLIIDFACGLLGWFIFANIVFIAIALMMIAVPSMDGFPFILIGIWAPTIIALVIFFCARKIWAGIGILVAVIANTILAGIFSGIFFHFSDALLTPLLIPMPTMYLTLFLVIANSAFPPYTVNNLTDLFFVQ